ncbi:MAG TPA: tRNA pseudouridine(54/55) synthase Pus10 [Candidatus Aenigmarchaeota archaeon]|nr:tRNA pseudouridine(54/55) synthase Pus10 [Candidatus Aenigmarchaeota archaeon]
MFGVIEKAKKVMASYYLCDNCLGRLFALLLTGMSNRERGAAIRKVIAMEYEAKRFKIKRENFYGIKFRKKRTSVKKPQCYVCKNIFDSIDKYVEDALSILKPYQFSTFLVGIKMCDEIVMREEQVLRTCGKSYAEDIKSELSREIGKRIELRTSKAYDKDMPDITIIFDLEHNKIELDVRSIFIYGEYSKLVRGIPQTKWDRYEESVEDIIAKPFIKALKGKGHVFHAAGREDIDARCLAYRPFVLEIKGPKKREVDIESMAKEINKSGKVLVRNLKLTERSKVRAVKKMAMDKIYRVVVSFRDRVKNIASVKGILGTVEQRTPRRVLHRRKDIKRYKKIKSIKWKKVNDKKYIFEICAESGTYIKELVNGDNGRTKPSIAYLLNNPAKVESLDVIGFGEKDGKKE